MKRLFSILSLVLCFSMILCACELFGNGKDNTTEPNDGGTTPTGTILGYWFCDAANAALEITEDSNTLKYYSLNSGYYEYYKVENATYSYDDTTNTLILTLAEQDYTFTFDPDEDILKLNKNTYVRKESAPIEHPTYSFPKFSEMDPSTLLSIPPYPTESARNEALAQARLEIFEKQYPTKENYDSIPTISDRAAEYGDYVRIDYKGMHDGVAFSGGTSENADVKILSNSGYIPGFVEGIIGKQVGDTFDVPVTFPEDYHAADLAGEAVVFQMTLKCIYDTTLTAEQFEDHNTPHATYEEWVMASTKEIAGGVMMQALSDKVTIMNGALPEDCYLYFYQSQLDQAHAMADRYGMTYEQLCTYYGGDQRPAFLQQAKVYATNYLIAYAIARTENLTPTEAQRASLYADFEGQLTQYGYTKEEAALYIQNNQADYFDAELMMICVEEWFETLVMGESIE